MYLTRKQKEVIDFLGNFIQEQGYSPSLEEIAMGLGLSSLATIHKHLKNLEAKGLLVRRWNHSRSLELTPEAWAILRPIQQDESGYEHNSIDINRLSGGAVDLPLVGRIAAGIPIEAIQDQETLSIPSEMIGRGRTYVLKVEGNSMIDEHIRDGDYVIVEERQTPHDGETVVALIRREETTLKKFYRESDCIRLQPANAAYDPIRVQPDEIEIQGVVIGVLRKY